MSRSRRARSATASQDESGSLLRHVTVIASSSEIKGHHYGPLLAREIFLGGELLNLGAVTLKARCPLLLGRISALNAIECFPRYPASNAVKTVHHRPPDAPSEFYSGLIECCKCHRILQWPSNARLLIKLISGARYLSHHSGGSSPYPPQPRRVSAAGATLSAIGLSRSETAMKVVQSATSNVIMEIRRTVVGAMESPSL
jgi:hypothetical protein